MGNLITYNFHMGFFKELKKRLFTLDVNQGAQNKKAKSVKRSPVSGKKSKAPEKQVAQEQGKNQKLSKYVAGLSKSSFSLASKIREMQARYNQINEGFFEELEEILIMADVSFKLVETIVTEVKKEVKKERVQDPELVAEIVADKMFAFYANNALVNTNLNVRDNRLNIILIVGVNGSGKTTTIAKLANKYVQEKKKVLIAAADTFRAGATEQLQVWATRVKADIVKSAKANADPGSVVYESLAKAKAEKYDVLIVDTAGRLQNKVNLMKELAKINKIIQSKVPKAPHETLLVMDATTGQNGISQARHFKEVTNVTGIVLTKMDGTSKGGIVLSIKDDLDLEVKLIGLGEKLDDLQGFDLDAFIYAIMKNTMSE